MAAASDAALRSHILAYLEGLSVRDSADESLEIAVQCLRESFALAETGAPPLPTALADVFSVGVAASATTAPALARRPMMTPQQVQSAPSMTAPEGGFAKFVENLSARGYFASVQEGSPEYAARLRNACEKFDERFSVVQPGTAAPASSAIAEPSASAMTLKHRAAAVSVRQLLAAGDCAAAAAAATAIIDQAEEDSEAGGGLAEIFGFRALSLLGTGERNSALADAEMASTLASNAVERADAQAQLAVCFEALGRHPEACVAYMRALATDESGLEAADAPRALLRAARRRLITAGSGGSGGSALAVRVPAGGTAAAGTPIASFDVNMMSAFLSDPSVLATASQVPHRLALCAVFLSHPDVQAISLGALSCPFSCPLHSGSRLVPGGLAAGPRCGARSHGLLLWHRPRRTRPRSSHADANNSGGRRQRSGRRCGCDGMRGWLTDRRLS